MMNLLAPSGWNYWKELFLVHQVTLWCRLNSVEANPNRLKVETRNLGGVGYSYLFNSLSSTYTSQTCSNQYSDDTLHEPFLGKRG